MAADGKRPDAGVVNGERGSAPEGLSPVMPDVMPDRASRSLTKFRQSMRKFCPDGHKLPLVMQSHCLGCDELVQGRFELVDGQVILSKNCPQCGQSREVHHDAIFTQAVSDRPASAEQTFSGTPIRPVVRSLPRTVETLCPQCGAILLGRYYLVDGKVLAEKTCPEHGYFRDCINSDGRLYLKASHWSFEEGPGQQLPQVRDAHHCPSNCGYCNQHISSGLLSQIDLTNRCNLNCPVCFANANSTGRVIEPSFEQVVELLQQLRDLRPIPATAVQLAGGEPTLHPEFERIVAQAISMGFSHVQAATNGLKLAQKEFAKSCAQAGLHTIYLQFDGLGADVYKKLRNRDIWQEKLKCIENCHENEIKVCLVPTIIKGTNDDQVGKILQFAIENIEVVSGISYQPVCFTGRIDHDQRQQQRYTLGDLAWDISESLENCQVYRDFYPLSIVKPFSTLLQALQKAPKITCNCHPDCSLGTYLLVSPQGKAYPFPLVFDIEGLFTQMNSLAKRLASKSQINWLDKWAVYRLFRRHRKKGAGPRDLTVGKFVKALMGMVDKSKGRGQAGQKTYRTLMVAGMHFQDRYNFDVERVKRCAIPYSTKEGIFPFCVYNSGPMYREFVEQIHSCTLEAYQQGHGH